jgi:hypothetical protein
MNEKTEAAPLYESLQDLIGQAISDEIAAGAEQPDWCDSEIDRLADAVMAALPKRRTTLSPELLVALDEAAKNGATVAQVAGGGLVFINRGKQLEDGADLNCLACGGSGHADDARGAAAPAGADDAFAAFCDREGYPSDGRCDAALRKAFDAGRGAQPTADAAPVDADKMRAQGRAEALAILMGLSAEGGIDAYTGWSKPVGPEDEGDAYWDEPKLRELFAVDGTLADMMNKAEAEHYQYLGMQQEAQHAKNFASNMHNSGKVRDVLAKAGEYDLIADLCRAAEPSTAQGDALSQQVAPSAQQERAWFKQWLAGLDGNITVDQVEFGRRVWAERARRAAKGGA